MAERYDLATAQGEDFELPLEWRNPDNADGSEGAPLNLTGYTAHMHVAPYFGQTAVLDLRTGGFGIAIDGPAGKVTVTVTKTQTAAVLPGIYVYDLFLTGPTPAFKAYRLLKGLFTVEGSVTSGSH